MFLRLSDPYLSNSEIVKAQSKSKSYNRGNRFTVFLEFLPHWRFFMITNNNHLCCLLCATLVSVRVIPLQKYGMLNVNLVWSLLMYVCTEYEY